MKKVFGLIIAAENAERIFFDQKSLYEKISKTFDEFFIINLINFLLFRKKILNNDKYFDNMLPQNFKVITPVSEDELKKFLIDKDLVAFMGFGKKLDNFKMQFLVKKYNISLIYLNNLGALGDHYLGRMLTKKKETKILRFYFFRLRRMTVHYLFRMLTILNVFPKIDIYFESIKAIVDNCNNSLAKKMEKIFPFLKICYFKKIIHIHSRSFDMSTKTKSNISEEKIVFIDTNFFDHIAVIAREGRIEKKLKSQYFNQLSQFLLELSNIFNKKVIICEHPTTYLDLYKKYLGTFEMCKFQTTENIRQAFIVVFHASTIIPDAIFLKKKIISLKSNILGEFIADRIDFFQKEYGLFSYSLDEKKELNKDLLQDQLEKITKNYDRYIKKDLIADDSMPGEDKIVNTIRKEYFANDKYF